MEEPKKSGEKNPNDMPISKEELAKLGIPKNVSMTRKELEQHLKTKELQSAAGDTKSIQEETLRQLNQLTKEEIDRAEEAGKKRQEMGR